jgi:hypothetical protein
MTLRAGIIGAGNIGWRYDGGRFDGTRSVSHAACIDRHPDTTLVCVLEPEPAARAEAAKSLPGTVAFPDDETGFFSHALDVVCIASPTPMHERHLEAAIDAGARYIFLEKPVTGDFAAYARLLDMVEKVESPPRIAVNYFRRSLPQAAELKQLCQQGEVVAADFTYSRGLAVNGVHLLDLCGYLFDLQSVPALSWIDPSDSANPSFGFRAGETNIRFAGMDLPYHCIECRLTFAGGRVSLLDGGAVLTRERRQDNAHYPGFFHLGPAQPVLDPAQCRAWMLDGTYLSFCSLLEPEAAPPSTLQTAAYAEGLLDLVMRSCSA